MEDCLEQGVRFLEVCYTFEGVAAWATRKWRANKPTTQAYRSLTESLMHQFKAVRWTLVDKEDKHYASAVRQCMAQASGQEAPKPKPSHKPVFKDIAQSLTEAKDSNYLCPQCLSVADDYRYPLKESGTMLVCAECELELANHNLLKYDDWRNCQNQQCEGMRCLEARVVLGDRKAMLALYCPFCDTMFLDQLMTSYWAKLWLDKAAAVMSQMPEIAEELSESVARAYVEFQR
jgi:hypothetical protein